MLPEKKIEIAAKALFDKKALDVSCVKVSELTSLSEYFLMASATSSTHVHALADEVDFVLSKAGLEPKSKEGRATDWVLLDYGDLIVHVFSANARAFYGLDKMWSDGTPVDLTAWEEK